MPHIIAPLGGVSGLITLFLGFGSKTPAKSETDRSWLAVVLEGASKAAAPIFMLFILILLSLVSSWLLNALATHLHGQGLTEAAGPESIGLRMPPKPLAHNLILHNATLSLILEMAGILGLIGILMAVTININQFSLHAMYRNRLIRAYLGASRRPEERKRLFNPFTGFDPRDNEAMCNLRFDDVRLARVLYRDHLSDSTRRLLEHCHRGGAPENFQDLSRALDQDIRRLIERGALDSMSHEPVFGPACLERLKVLTRIPPEQEAWRETLTWLRSILLNRLDKVEPRPLHVLNIALNLVRGENLAWQQRKAQSLTVSALHCGSFNLGYRRSQDYGKNVFLNRPISLGTALAISGAAASPNMGYHSSPAVTFLLALFNVRLGWWLGNPGSAGAATYSRASPAFAVGPLFSEAFGLTDAGHPYVYLSDGGHFENLGLYEMVLRRCHSILVVDAGCDPVGFFEDLGNAIRKIQVDLGIEIEMDLELLKRQPASSVSRGHHAIGSIRYDKVDGTAAVGTIVYLKPSLTGDEPTDVHEYAVHHPAFPHESTSDQFFDESQFQSYSRLGEHAAWEVLSPAAHCADEGFVAVCEELRSHWITAPSAMQDFFLRETPGLTQLNQLLRNDPHLLHYDLQLYPELQSLFGYPSPDSSSIDPRSALHACSAQLQVMEKVFYALRLEDFHAHPLSRGWMNLFRRWTSTPTLRGFWPTLCGSYSRQFVDFVQRHLNLAFDQALVVSPCEELEQMAPLFAEMARECHSIPEYLDSCRRAFHQPAPLRGGQRGQDGVARWALRILPADAEQANGQMGGQLLAIAAATVLSGRDLGLYAWVRPAYRGLGVGSRLLQTALQSLGQTYAGYTATVDLGPDGANLAGYYDQKAVWSKFYEQLGFTRDRSAAGRLRMKRTLK
jgi:GNAT superfamily N-acetyltransferase